VEALSLPTLWLAVCPHEAPPDWEAQLSDAEQGWLRALKAPRRRMQTLSARILARQALAAHFPGCDAGISLSAGDGIAPALTGPFKGAHLSLAHSQDLCACLIDSVPCGVDIEYNLAARDFLAVAEKSFDQAQFAGLRALGPAQQPTHFYRLWCAREAALKAAQPSPRFHRGTYASFTLATATLSPAAQIPVRLADLTAAKSQALPSLDAFRP
jgi:phosphopantetheinyl transferase